MKLEQNDPIRTMEDVRRFESERSFEERVAARGIYEVFAESAAAYGERTALTMIMTGAEDERTAGLTYRALFEQIGRAATLFSRLAGARPGVAYVLPNLIETHVTLWGAETAGYAVPINFLLQPSHIAELIAASGARILVTLGPHPRFDIWEKALAIKKILPDLILVQVGGDGADHDAIPFGAALEQQAVDPGVFGAPGRGDDVAAYFHTGGTTGAPKLVAHTHRNQLVAGFGGAALLDLSENDVLTNGLPMFHVGSCILCSLSVLMVGGEVLILSPAGMRNPDMIGRYWRIVERHRATVLACVPTAWGAVLAVPLDADVSSVRLGVAGASASPAPLARDFNRVTGKQLHDVLGMTEAGGVVAITPAHAAAVPGSVGLRLPYTRLEVRRLGGDGGACAPHEVGLLMLGGPTVSPGYRDPSTNAGAFADGQLNSGDLAYLDGEGRLYIAGREKDLIIRGGHNIDPAVIEEALAAHPAVALAAAVGQPDRYAGELPVCYVTLRAGAAVDAAELSRFCEPLISERPAWPKQIHIIDAMPLTGVGKIFKPALRCDAAKRVVLERIADLVSGGAATVDVAAGGKRGMVVSITLKDADPALVTAITGALDGYLFDLQIKNTVNLEGASV